MYERKTIHNVFLQLVIYPNGTFLTRLDLLNCKIIGMEYLIPSQGKNIGDSKPGETSQRHKEGHAVISILLQFPYQVHGIRPYKIISGSTGIF
jgi:hypothetical protein